MQWAITLLADGMHNYLKMPYVHVLSLILILVTLVICIAIERASHTGTDLDVVEYQNKQKMNIIID